MAGSPAVLFDPASLPHEQVSQAVIDELLKRGVVEKGDWVILTKGDSYHTIGDTNGMKILNVGDKMCLIDRLLKLKSPAM